MAQHHQFDHLHERRGGRIPACAGVERGQSAGDFCGQRQRAVALGRTRIGESTGAPEPVCSSTDASHFQNLNGSLGSLAEVESISQAGATPYTMMAGLGANGTAGVSGTSGPTTDWPEILGGEGGPVAIDPVNSDNWYVNNGAGVSIYLGTPPEGSTPGSFSPVLNETTDPGTDVVKDGLTMTRASAFSGGPARPHAVADGNLPAVARAGQRRGLERRQRRQLRCSTESSSVNCSGDAPDPLDGCHGAARFGRAALGRGDCLPGGCTARPMAARRCPGTFSA